MLRDYLLHIVKADPGAIPFYAQRTDGLWGCGIDAVSALDCWGVGFPGFQGLKLAPGGTDAHGLHAARLFQPPADRTRSIFRTATRRSRGCWCAS